jgi:hypothetical protein
MLVIHFQILSFMSDEAISLGQLYYALCAIGPGSVTV